MRRVFTEPLEIGLSFQPAVTSQLCDSGVFDESLCLLPRHKNRLKAIKFRGEYEERRKKFLKNNNNKRKDHGQGCPLFPQILFSLEDGLFFRLKQENLIQIFRFSNGHLNSSLPQNEAEPSPLRLASLLTWSFNQDVIRRALIFPRSLISPGQMTLGQFEQNNGSSSKSFSLGRLPPTHTPFRRHRHPWMKQELEATGKSCGWVPETQARLQIIMFWPHVPGPET